MQTKRIHRARRVCAATTAGVLVSALAATAATAGPDPTWIEQLGGSSYDSFRAVATDANNIVVAGQFDNKDPFLRKYDGAGAFLWQRKLTTGKLDSANGVAIDTAGNIVISMESSYPLDTFVAKFNSAGKQLWSKRFDSGSNDFAYRVAVDSAGNVYTAGSTGGLASTQRDFVLVKFNSGGVKQWSKMSGVDGFDECNGIAVAKDDNVILVGGTTGPLFGVDPGTDADAWVAKFDKNNGNVLWGKQFDSQEGTRADHANAVAIDPSGNVLVTGSTTGRLPGSATDGDLWVAKYSPTGVRSWVRQFEFSNTNDANGVATDGSGNVLVTGRSSISSSAAAFVRKYSPAGALLWTSVLDSGDGDGANAVATDGAGNVYVAGFTEGNLDGTNKGRTDGFLAKFPRQ